MHLKRRWFVACELCLVLQVFFFFSSCAKTLRCVFFSLGLCCAAVYQQDLLADGLPDVLCIFFFLQSECSLSLSFSSEPSPACWRQCFPASLSFTRIRVRLRWLNSLSEPVKKKKKAVLVFHKVGNFALFLHLVTTEAASASNCHISLLQLVTRVTTSRVKFANHVSIQHCCTVSKIK